MLGLPQTGALVYVGDLRAIEGDVRASYDVNIPLFQEELGPTLPKKRQGRHLVRTQTWINSFQQVLFQNHFAKHPACRMQSPHINTSAKNEEELEKKG
jgi:hypothetical protein